MNARFKKEPVVLYFTDAEKVFDRVDWLFMQKALKKHGSGVTLLK